MICDNYLTSIVLYWEYYINDSIQSPDFYYRYIAAPMMGDLIKNTSNGMKKYTNQLHNYTIFEQLLCVIPLTRKQLLPTPLQDVISSEHNPISHWYVDDILIEPITGQTWDQSSCFLPEINTSHATLLVEICEHLMNDT